MKIAFCWTSVSGYMASGWQAMHRSPNINLKVFSHAQANHYQFENEALMRGLDWTTIDPNSADGFNQLKSGLDAFSPDIIIFSGWTTKACRKLPFLKLASKPKLYMVIDTQWTGTLRQRLAPLALRRITKNIAGIIVPGKRGIAYAQRLGFHGDNIILGLYPFDDTIYKPIKPLEASCKKSFAFIGRYHPVKGIETLVQAYSAYRDLVSDPWELVVCGSGPLKSHFEGVEGIIDYGFTQPKDIPDRLKSSQCFVLPSTYEPWGVVLAEACGMGLAVIATDVVGATTDLVANTENGWLIPPENTQALTQALCAAHNAKNMSDYREKSLIRAQSFRASSWPDRILSQITKSENSHTK